MLRPSEREIQLKRAQAKEYFRMHGIPAKVYQIDIKSENIYGDDTHVYYDPVKANVIFEQFPNVRTLKKLGWYNADMSELPWILYVPYTDDADDELRIQENVKLEITMASPFTETELLKVKKVAGKGFSSVYWVANVVPVFGEEKPVDPNDKDDDGFSFINRG